MYKIGRNDITATILVPRDCGYSCHFCDKCVKKDDHLEKDAVIKMLDVLFLLDGVSGVTFSGGEPLFYPKEDLIDIIKYATKRNKLSFLNTVYSNNPLLRIEPVEDVIFSLLEEGLAGISISRHGRTEEEDRLFFSNDIMSDKLIFELGKEYGSTKSLRINCTVDPADKYFDPEPYIKRWKGSGFKINFRQNYNKTLRLGYIEDLPYKVTSRRLYACDGCEVCWTGGFSSDDGYFNFHQGFANTLIKDDKGDVLIHDFIINKYGQVYLDWDMIQELNPDIYFQLLIDIETAEEASEMFQSWIGSSCMNAKLLKRKLGIESYTGKCH